MVALSLVRASNAGIRNAIKASPTAVFVGASEGIGLATLKGFVANTNSPTIYLIGRSQKKGDDTFEALKKVNNEAKYEFLTADFTLLQDVDRLTKVLVEKTGQDGIDFLSLSPGVLAFSRKETKEGIDFSMALRYYSRVFFIDRLFSSLSEAKRPKKVLSILAGGTEELVNESDLALSNPANFSVMKCAGHTATMTSLAFEHLATLYPTTTFIHAYPGLVKTGGLTSWTDKAWAKLAIEYVAAPLLTPFTVALGEAGERMLFYLTSKRYAPLDESKGSLGVELPEGLEKAKGQGKGGKYAVLRYSDLGDGKCMAGYRERGFEKNVWEDAQKVFGEALKTKA